MEIKAGDTVTVTGTVMKVLAPSKVARKFGQPSTEAILRIRLPDGCVMAIGQSHAVKQEK